MNYAAYAALLAEICAAAGLEDPARLVDGGRLDVSGHTVSFRYDEAADAQHAAILVDLGEVPEHEREQVFRTALETNAQAKTVRDGAVGLDPESSRLTYLFFVPLDGSCGAADVLGTITDLLADREQEPAESEAASLVLPPAGLHTRV